MLYNHRSQCVPPSPQILNSPNISAIFYKMFGFRMVCYNIIMNIKKHKNLIVVLVLIVVVTIIFSVNQIMMLQKAHSTFDNYYNFRGCIKLISKTSDYGICQISSEQIIKIVKFDNRWFLDRDLPCGFLCF